MTDLGGRVVAFLESRRSSEMSDLITRHGGVAYPVPCLVEEHHPDAEDVAVAVDELCGDAVDIVVFMTGVGASTILEGARRHNRLPEVLAGLGRKLVVARGPKPLAVLRKAGVRIDRAAPPPNTSQQVLDVLPEEDVRGRTVLVQLYGGPNPDFRQQLEQRGATVLEVAPYVWVRPADPEGVIRLVDAMADGRVDVLAVTSAAQVDNLFEIASQQGRADRLRDALRQVPVAAQGPVCAAALERHGLEAMILPAHGHMGALVLAIAGHFASN